MNWDIYAPIDHLFTGVLNDQNTLINCVSSLMVGSHYNQPIGLIVHGSSVEIHRTWAWSVPDINIKSLTFKICVVLRLNALIKEILEMIKLCYLILLKRIKLEWHAKYIGE